MNYDRYIGLPYKENGRDESGIDCWGLARLFYKRELDIDLPSYAELYDGSYDVRVPQTIEHYKDNWTRTDTPQTGDLCLFKIMGEPSHVGIYIGGDKFLHSRDGKDSVIERLDNPMWFRRLEGFYKYTEKFNLIPAVGSPNPLQWNQLVEAVQEGANALAFAHYLSAKYKFSEEYQKRLVLFIDGVVVPREQWETTYFTKDSVVNYKVIVQGRDGKRLAVFAAVIVAALVLGPEVGAMAYNAYYAEAIAAGLADGMALSATAATVPTAWATAGTMAVQFAGMTLANALMPIRPPKDLGQAVPTSTFTGAQNQANPFGGIPVLLGKTRVTGVLGAVPYNEPTFRSSKLHLLIIWGFGPLYVDLNSLSVGGTSIARLIGENSITDKKITLLGVSSETEFERKQFNSLYPTDVQQKPNSPLELYNDGTGTQPWTWVSFTQPATTIKLAINFPEGLRDIKASKGEQKEATVKFAFTKPIPHTFPENPSNGATAVLGGVTYTWDSDRGIWLTTATPALSGTIQGATYRLLQETSVVLPPVPAGYYRKTVISLPPNANELVINQGHQSTTQGNPNLATRTTTYASSYTSLQVRNTPGYRQQDLSVDPTIFDDVRNPILVDAVTDPAYDSSFSWEPNVPSTNVAIWSYVQDSSGIISYSDLRASHAGISANGLTGGNLYAGNKITIASGYFQPSSAAIGDFVISPYDTSYLIFSTTSGTPANKTFSNTTTVTSSAWKNVFLKDNGVWKVSTGSIPTTDRTVEVQKTDVIFPLPGYYTVDFSADNEGVVEIGKTTTTLSRVIVVGSGQDDNGGWKDERVLSSDYSGIELAERITSINPIRALYHVKPGEEGAHIVKVWAKNHETTSTVDSNGNADMGFALRIIYEYDGIVNINRANTGEYDEKTVTRLEKDGFNEIFEWTNLPRATYTIGVKRITQSDPRNGDWQRLWRTYLQTVTAYDSENKPPLIPLPTREWYNDTTLVKDHRNLCRTAITVQSTNKVNGNIEGVNALVQTIALVYDNSINATTAVSTGSFVLGQEYVITTVSGTNFINIGATTNVIGSKFIATNNGTNNGTGTATPTGWKEEPTNNPASLFRYVLQHTANAFPVSDSELDLIKLQEWYDFCNSSNSANGRPKLTYNNILTNTQNLMEVLRDICAAGMASPTFINGKWSVVIDTVRPYTVQHFTPHNSWGFESTKILARIPHAFRVSFPNETLAYQITETIVYDWGYGETAGYEVTAGNFIVGQEYKITKYDATTFSSYEAMSESGQSWGVGTTFIATSAGTGTGRAFSIAAHTPNSTTIKQIKVASQFESIQLPGVTSPDQVRFFAKWHFAQLHKRPERYSLNVDFEYLICSRGDKIKITHDLPLWGAGTGRVKSISSNDILLTESILFNTANSYQILVRLNPPLTPAKPALNQIPSFKGSIQPLVWDTATSTWIVATSPGYYDKVRISTTITGNLSDITADNLVMIGEVDKVTQDLIVLSIEPGQNLTAKLTLADYAEDIYTIPIDDLNIAFDSKISFEKLDIVKNLIFEQPIIVRVSTQSINSQEIAPGINANNATITFSNAAKLTSLATKIQFDIIEANALFEQDKAKNPQYVEKEAGTINIIGLKSNITYKIRARYSNSDNSVFGPWTEEILFYNTGYQVNEFNASSILLILEGTNLIVRPVDTTGEYPPKNHIGYEFRLYRNSGTGDFWATDINPIDKAVNYLEKRNTSTAIFDLLSLPKQAGTITGSISGTTLTVTAISTGGLVVGGILDAIGISEDITIISQLTSTETDSRLGMRGTYSISTAQTFASNTINILVKLLDEVSPGVKYRVACRSIDKAGNYNTTSLLASITLQTIQPPTLVDGG